MIELLIMLDFSNRFDNTLYFVIIPLVSLSSLLSLLIFIVMRNFVIYDHLISLAMKKNVFTAYFATLDT